MALALMIALLMIRLHHEAFMVHGCIVWSACKPSAVGQPL
jgi:hypothetical protein